MRVAWVVVGLLAGCVSGPQIGYDRFSGVCSVSAGLDAGGPSLLRGHHGSDVVTVWWVPGPFPGVSTFQCVRGADRVELSGDEINVRHLSYGSGITRQSERIAVGDVADIALLSDAGWECRFYNHQGPLTPKDRATIAQFVRLVSGPRPAACGPSPTAPASERSAPTP